MNNKETKPGRDSKGRYIKGHNPNPKGRPKKVPQKPTSSFDVIFDRKITLTAADGSCRELTAEQALQHATLKAALEGKAGAINRVVKWLIKRERWIRKEAEKKAARAKKYDGAYLPNHFFSKDPENADEALQILGIAVRDPLADHLDPDRIRLVLENWAVDMALLRWRGSEPLTAGEIQAIEICTLDEENLSWPKGVRV
ncbi:MAG: hypothetical protein KUG69_11020 [Marinosulfonomonas sp.]|nr:hypothetical protein [Marinosulfonomonas sp.]